MGNILKNNFYSFDLKIWNDGIGILNWYVYSNLSYINVNPSNGSSTDEYSNIKVILNTNNLTSGDYHESINIVSDGGDYNFLLNFTINSPPDNPKIYGETNVKSGEEFFYEIFTHDPNSDNISYLIDWGDDSKYNWSKFITSDEVYNITKIWNNKGIYIVRVKAKDIYNEESSWTTLEIEVPKNYFINNFFFKFINLLLKY
jgi:hypothetical protein